MASCARDSEIKRHTIDKRGDLDERGLQRGSLASVSVSGKIVVVCGLIQDDDADDDGALVLRCSRDACR
jgi:hypothetical protein